MFSFAALVAIVVFLFVYMLIVSEKVNKTVVVMLGSLLLFLFKIYVDQNYDTQFSHAIDFVDFNVIGLIIGMMIIVQVTNKSGVFTHVAMRLVAYAKCDMKKVFFLLMLFTALITAFISNVTAVMVMTPIFLAICLRFKLNPVPFLMTEILMSNIGGTATPLGDMTNIIIASKAGFSFAKIVSNLGPVVIVVAIVVALLAILYFGDELKSKADVCLEDLQGESFIQDRSLMVKGLSVLFVVVLALIFKNQLSLDNGPIAMAGAMFLLLITGIKPEEAFKDYVNWSINFFFVGLFILIGALEVTGVVDVLAHAIVDATGDNLGLLAIIMLLVSAIFSAFIDNIPFATTMIPIIQNIGVLTEVGTDPLFWALALGACIGGSGTIIGASCNLVVIGLAEHNGIKITFFQYLKYAFPMMLLGILISAIYLYLFML